MLNVFKNAWKVKDIRNKMLYTLMILAIVRLGSHIAIPGIDVMAVKAARESASTGTLYNIIAGGANSRWSIMAMGIGPYITSSIIMQLLRVAIPKLDQIGKEGEDGRRKIQAYTRNITVLLAAIQGIGLTLSYKSMFITQSAWIYVIAVLSLICGTTFVMWLAEQITSKGIGNGSSMIIFINIVSNLPLGVSTLYYYASGGDVKGVGHVSAGAHDIDGGGASRHGSGLLPHHPGKAGDFRRGFALHPQGGEEAADLGFLRLPGHKDVHHLFRLLPGQILSFHHLGQIAL